ncbi:inner membrane transporter RhtA [Kitasatospora sp. MAP12-15]|uniref:EamA family transporter n=1 Tax=unclassified Kitasatospora TaxID=2633591 RepID=UPI0024734866|nr:EamA family transporter [Kitasatospora sp. MAP12-44]MDH6108707.1 inner membrane transporter RhtA [Kitasatospora sp. MAP12-44]
MIAKAVISDGAVAGGAVGRVVSRTLGRAPAGGLVVAGLCGLQGGAALATRLYPAVGIGGVVSLRLCLAAAVLCALWRPGLLRERGTGLRREPGTLGLIAAAGTLLAIHHLTYYNAVARLPLGAATTVEFLGPFALALAGSRRGADLAWALLALTGVALLGGGGLALNAVGLGFAAVAGACWAGYILVSARLAHRVRDGGALALAVTWGALLSLPFGLASGGTALLKPWVLALGLAVAVLSSVLPYSFQFEAIRRLPAGVFGILTSLEPALGAVVGLLFLDQRLAAVQWIGIAAVASASAGATRPGGRPSSRPSPRPSL